MCVYECMHVFLDSDSLGPGEAGPRLPSLTLRSIHIWPSHSTVTLLVSSYTECTFTLHKDSANYGAGANMVAEEEVRIR